MSAHEKQPSSVLVLGRLHLHDRRRTTRQAIGVAAIAVLVTCLILNVVWVRADREDDDRRATGKEAVAAAQELLPQILSYDYTDLSQYKQRIKRLTSGELAQNLTQLFNGKISTAAKRDHIVTRATVPALAVVDVKDDQHVVLLAFVNQITRKKKPAQPLIEGSRVTVELVRVGGDWKVAELDPV